jgi:VanZ family protein
LRNDGLARWLPALTWAALIWTLSTGWFSSERTSALILPLLATLFPGRDPVELRAMHAVLRKLAHFGEYVVLSILLYRALRGGRRWNVRAAALALVVAGLYAVSDELHQLFVPGRTAAAMDCLIDFTGAVAGQGLLAARAVAFRLRPLA